jgi:hypothetical protein
MSDRTQLGFRRTASRLAPCFSPWSLAMSRLTSQHAAGARAGVGFVDRSAARRRAALVLPAFVLMAWWSGPVHAIDIVAIEEHWELEVGEPDASSSGPQVCMVTSPTGTLDGDYFVFTLNHHSHPDYVPGGMQVQQWCGEDIVDGKVGPSEGTLHHNNETIKWVQRTEVSDGQLTFEILSGESESWGSFGGTGHLRFVINTELTTLNGYRPAISLGESGVSFAGNRVRSLVLRKLRWIDSAGNAYELNAPIDIDADLDP